MLSTPVQLVALARHHHPQHVIASRNLHERVFLDGEKAKWLCEEDGNTKPGLSAPGSATPSSLLSIISTFLANRPVAAGGSRPRRRICSSLPKDTRIGIRYTALEVMMSPPDFTTMSPPDFTTMSPPDFTTMSPPDFTTVSPPDFTTSMADVDVDFPKPTQGPTRPLPPLPTPSKRVKKLARAEKLQLSPSALAQARNRTPGTPSPLNSNRPVSKQNALEGAQSIMSPTARLAKDYNPETPKQFAMFPLSKEEQKSDNAPIRGFSLQEFLQEDKQKENDELIDNILEKVSTPSIHSPLSPSSARNNSPVTYMRARGKKIKRRLISFGQSKDEEPRPKQKFDPKAVAKITPTNESSPFHRVHSDPHSSVPGLFKDKQAHTVGGPDRLSEDHLSVSDFLELGLPPRPDSPTLGHATVKGGQGDRREPEQQEEDDVFRIRDTSFSNQRAQKRGPLAYKSPAPLRLPQHKQNLNASPSIPTVLVRDDRDDFLASTVAALHSVSTTSPAPSSSTLSESKTPRRCVTTPLSLQRATSTTPISTNRFDPSSTVALLDHSNRNSIASTIGTKRRSLNSIIESRRNSLASIIELKQHPSLSDTNASRRLSNPRVEELKHDSAEMVDEAPQDLRTLSVVEKCLSEVSAETTMSNVPGLGRHLTVKEIRKWSPFSMSHSPQSPPTPSHSRAFLPHSRVVTPQSPLDLVKLDGCSEKAHEFYKQSVAERVPIARQKIIQLKFDHLEFDEDIVQLVRKEPPSLTEEEKLRERKNALAALLGWNDLLGVDWGENDKAKKAECEEICKALKPQMMIEPKNPCAPTFTLDFPTVMEFMSNTAGEQDTICTARTSITETEMSSFDLSRRNSKATSKSETSTSPFFNSMTRSTTAQTSWSEAPMSPPLGMSRSTSSSEFPLLSPVPSFFRPTRPVGHSFSSQLANRRPSDAAATVANPFGSLVHWDRPTETAEEKRKRKIMDMRQKLRNEELEKQGVLLVPDLLQLNGKFKGMERYIAHDLVQRDLRKAYDECDKALVSATNVAREYLDLWNPECTSELAIDAPPFVQPDVSSALSLDCIESVSMAEERARKCAYLTLVGEEGILNFRLVWAQQFLDRCERNGW
ncbi:hypothetical protein E2P81_ATG06518 [Venturia nashicola]|uniref:Uncharacterized protein n=1 Tax=Venturia nashicola TaxID=86259 RepID=A0A4Z1P526_9PEZI|nr:hypothetical protein E6O75_ATG06686 [Venturia nashicola]TLD29865.1 hypothetical protein E2P81_ATG06518 [Venturia nashicola]